MKELIINLLKKETKLSGEEIKNLIEIPPSSQMGDYSFPCFVLSKREKKSPNQIAEYFVNKIKLPKEIDKMENKGPYLNFFISKKILAKNILFKILKEGENYGHSNFNKNKNFIIDMSSPNIAKPFGIGHLRSTIIGNAIANIAKSQGYNVTKINYLGDWGTQFGKLIVGLKHFGNEKELEKNPIKHMLEIYVKANAKEYEEEARMWFKKLEEGDKEVLKLWKRFKELSLKDFKKIYDLMRIEFDVWSGESLYNEKMSETIEKLKKKKLLKLSDGALVVDLEEYNLGVCLIQKSDGATLYATRDITAAIDRFEKYKFDKAVYEVGHEQSLHFQQFFKILELMGYSFAKNCIHASHGLYLDSDGKKFATRKGKTVFMEDILNEAIQLAQKTIEEKNPSIKNKKEIARKIAIAAIFYGDLKNNRNNDLIFDIKKFLDFEGNTGPYLQYSYVRASSILKKSKHSENKIKVPNKIEESEFKLIKKLENFPEILIKANESLLPNLIANYSFELAQIFNEFYHSCPVLGGEFESFRLFIVDAFRIVLKNSLSLLGIETTEEM